MPDKRKIYLGDSVYAEPDPYLPGTVVLTTENGYPDDPRNRIVLEPEVLEALDRFRGRGAGTTEALGALEGQAALEERDAEMGMSGPDPIRDCPHGHQRGKCDTCSLIEAEAEIARLRAENERLRGAAEADIPNAQGHVRPCSEAEWA